MFHHPPAGPVYCVHSAPIWCLGPGRQTGLRCFAKLFCEKRNIMSRAAARGAARRWRDQQQCADTAVVTFSPHHIFVMLYAARYTHNLGQHQHNLSIIAGFTLITDKGR